ncbi:MAG: hypothetical protein J5966_07650 [Lachnospiraceae bacterium]|nr:hypothetical protein [Lachnospiraceae bacterium]
MAYKHNIVTKRDTAMPTLTDSSTYGVQVVVGTAPVNLLDDPAAVVNTPILANNITEAKKTIGWSEDFAKYTLMQSAYASFVKFGVAPVVFINVLDPAVHKAAVAAKAYTLVNGAVTIDETGILPASVTVTYGDEDTEAVKGTDYITSFDADGKLVIAATSDGALASVTSIKTGYNKIDPGAVTISDIIGGTDAQGNRKGIDVIDIVYSKLGVVPSMILAPGFSKNPAVAVALEAKAELIGSLVTSHAFVDIESTTTKVWTGIEAAKSALGVNSRWSTAAWPMAKMGNYQIYASAIVAAAYQRICVDNGDVPARSSDNLEARIDGVCLEDGTELQMNIDQVNDYINAKGVVSFLYLNGWKVWGSNTTAYPEDKAPNNRFTKCVLMGNYLENRFKVENLSHIGNNGSPKEMESIVTNYNMTLNALVPDRLAGAEIQFLRDENPKSEMIEGRYKFHTIYADYTPTEYIENQFTWDASVLEAAFEGGEQA